MKNRPHLIAASLLTCAVLPLTGTASTLLSGGGFNVDSHAFRTEGKFTVVDGQAHYWALANSTDTSASYQIYDFNATDGNNNSLIGHPVGGTISNRRGDAFGVYDKQTGTFYAGTSHDSSHIYRYNAGQGGWIAGNTTLPNAYDGATHNGSLYLTGLPQPWTGGTGQSNSIYKFNPDGRQDTLVETGENSGSLAIADNGDFYYASYGDNAGLYRWSAAQIASVTNDFDHETEDTFLTLDTATQLVDFREDGSGTADASGNGVAVDAAGNVFFSVNDYMAGVNYVGVVHAGTGEVSILLDQDDLLSIFADMPYVFLGALSIDGDFFAGASLYLSSFDYDIISIQVPEPATYALLTGFVALLAVARLRRRSRSR